MNLEHRPDYAVNWPRAVQSSVAILGALTFGAIAYGYGYGVSSGRTESYPQGTAPDTTSAYCQNEPAGMTQLTNRTFQGEALTLNPITGWSNFDTTGVVGVTSGFTITTDATAPQSADSVGTMVFVSLADGQEPGNTQYAMTKATYDSVYTCLTMRFSSGYDFNTNTEKIWFQISDSIGGAGDPLFFWLDIDGGTGGEPIINYAIQGGANGTPDNNIVFDTTAWNEVEAFTVMTATDTIIQVWVNGSLSIADSTVAYGRSHANTWFDFWKWQPTCGGGGNSCDGEMFMDRIYISGS